MTSPKPPEAAEDDRPPATDLPAIPAAGLPEPEVVDQPSSAAARPNRMLIVAGAVAAVLLVGTGIAIGEAIGSPSNSSGNDAAAPESPFPAAKKKCAPSSDHAKVGDDGKSLTLAGQGDKSGGLPYTAIACVLAAVETPDAVIAHMDSTRALDGRQTAEWKDIQASWTYHPDNGFKVILTFSGSASEK